MPGSNQGCREKQNTRNEIREIGGETDRTRRQAWCRRESRARTAPRTCERLDRNNPAERAYFTRSSAASSTVGSVATSMLRSTHSTRITWHIQGQTGRCSSAVRLENEDNVPTSPTQVEEQETGNARGTDLDDVGPHVLEQTTNYITTEPLPITASCASHSIEMSERTVHSGGHFTDKGGPVVRTRGCPRRLRPLVAKAH